MDSYIPTLKAVNGYIIYLHSVHGKHNRYNYHGYVCPSECLEGVASYTVGRIMDLSVADQLLLMNQKVPGLKIQ